MSALTAGYSNMLFWISFPQRGGNNSFFATHTFWPFLENDLGIPLSCPLNSSHPPFVCWFLGLTGVTANPLSDITEGWIVWKPLLFDVWEITEWSGAPQIFFLLYVRVLTEKEKKKSPLNSRTILPANSPNTTAQHSPWKHVSAALIQTRRHNLQLSLDSSTSRGRGGNQTNDKRQKGHFHLDQPGRLADSTGREESREKLRFNVKDMKDVYSRQGRCWRLHLRER